MLGVLSRFSIAVGNPWVLLALVALLPPLFLIGRRGLSGLGAGRRAVALLLRASVVTLIVLALAGVQAVRRDDRLTTIFLMDVSESIPVDRQKDMLDYVRGAVRDQKPPDDLAGVVVFGKDARVEVPPTVQFPSLNSVENRPSSSEYTDLAGAIKLALASFPEDTARRLVILSDGNENRGNAIEQARAASGLNVQIDALPIDYKYDSEVLVEKVAMPPDVKKGETVNINVVVRASEPTSGTLQVFQRTQNAQEVATGEVPEVKQLQRGLNVFSLKRTITESNFYTFTAVFVPDKDSGDKKQANNLATGFVHARGEAKVLLIEGTKGEHAELVQALRDKKIEVDVLVAPRIDSTGIVGGDALPDQVAQLQPYDAVILGDVPKESFTDGQIEMLAANCHDFGAGLIMLGGPSSFGAGKWMDTPVEKALPVDMQIKDLKITGKSALVMIMHASEIPEGNFWQKKVGQEAIKTLSPFDYAGMLYYEQIGGESWLFPLKTIGESKGSMLRAVDRMQPGDMPDFDPGLILAMDALRKKTDAMTKHMIVISDGDPVPATTAVINRIAASKITVTSVLVAAHGGDSAGVTSMQDLAHRTKGRFYNVKDPKTLPRIYAKETRLISKPLIHEQPGRPWAPTLRNFSEPIAGMPSDLPGITGLVLTTPKENALVDIPITSKSPPGQLNPLLAHWTYGLGRSVAFTSDAGRRWTTAWRDWDSYPAFWSQVVRWSMRPTEDRNMTLSVRREGASIKVVVDALDKKSDFLNFLQFDGKVVKPDLSPAANLELRQTAPGRYEGTFDDAEAKGNYFVNLGYVGTGGTHGVLSTGVSVPYSDEYRELRSNPTTLENLVSITEGRMLAWAPGPNKEGIDAKKTVAQADVFRRDPSLVPPRSFRDLWPDLLLAASLLFLADVGVRRVAPDFKRMGRAVGDYWTKLRGGEVVQAPEYMEKLRSRKAEVAEQIDRGRDTTRFEAPVLPTSTVADEPLLGNIDAPIRSPGDRPMSPKPGIAPTPKPAEPEGYASRLMKAKQKVWEDREKEKGKP